MGSPRLTEDELKLTLYAYTEIGRSKSFSDSHHQVQWLSEVLNLLPIHSPDERPDNSGFRTPDGVASRVRAFKLIDENRNPRKLTSYRKVWNRYEDDWDALRADVRDLLSEYGVTVAESPEVLDEIARRENLWEKMHQDGGPTEMEPSHLRDLGIYGGGAGIWRDMQLTEQLSSDGCGVTVSVLHTGQSYPDDLSEIELIYHYPNTDRAGRRDQNEIEATKNAKRFGVPIFVILYADESEKMRDVYLGRVIDWNDETSEFLIRYGADRQRLDAEASTTVVQPQKSFELTGNRSADMRKQKARPGQSTFRFEVFQRYGPECAICSVDVKPMLEAAHVRDKQQNGSDDPRNGLVLCRNHHGAFDQGLFAIEPETHRISVAEGFTRNELGIESRTLSPVRNRPHQEALRWHWDEWTEEHKS